MEEQKKTPLWVLLAFSSITKRKHALWLIWACLVFSVYCIPWALMQGSPVWLGKFFLIKDWSWLAMMVPIVLWYCLCLRWMDNNAGWDNVVTVDAQTLDD